jgi:hypothetical protein
LPPEQEVAGSNPAEGTHVKALWPSGLGAGLQNQIHRFEPGLRLAILLELFRITTRGVKHMSHNLYSHPEAFGWSTFGEINLDTEDYGFDMFVVWRTSDGTFVWGNDSGCSCPEPFEDTTTKDVIPLQSLAQFENAVRADPNYRECDDVDLVVLLERLHVAGLR